MSLIVQKSPDLLNMVKEDGFSALHLASLNGHHNVVQCLIEVGTVYTGVKILIL